MTKLTVQPVVLCGGSGTRLWPLSRTGFPKQFLALSGLSSLFQQAVGRLCRLACDDIEMARLLVVTNEEHRFLALEQLRELHKLDATLILEPVGRNTAAALTLAALDASALGDDPILVVTPADQVVRDDASFNLALLQSARAAAGGGVVILGVTPDRPETGYGYVQHGGSPGEFGEFGVVKFTEKPDLDLAMAYVAGGLHTWNSGMFVLRASTWLNALELFRPDILLATQTAWAARTIDSSFVRPDKDAFVAVPSESIDYAVMERCPGSAVSLCLVPLDAGWSDLGSWDAVWRFNQEGQKDDHGNVALGDTMLAETRDTFVHASNRLVSAVGVSDLIIVETSDAVLVADRSRSQDVKKLVHQLQHQNRNELNSHRKVHRPWGWYDSIDEGERFKVKRIQVNPGASLSLQMHNHRAEHWVVVRGEAQITIGERVLTLTENQSTFIPLGETHRLANLGSIPLEIIEVQSGGYLGEDDIVRFEDAYGRT